MMVNPRTRSAAGLGVVLAVAFVVISAQMLVEASGMRYVIQGVAFGIGWLVGYAQPSWLRSQPPPFAAQYERVDRAARELLRSAEASWQAGDSPVESEVEQFNAAIASYGSLKPPSRAWTDVITERRALLRAWRDVLRNPSSQPESTFAELRQRETVLGERVRNLT
jgi:hypothetical protein